MTESIFLTREDVGRLTGVKRKKTQIEKLTAQRIPFYVNVLGWPVVPRAAVEGGKAVVPAKRWEPRVLQGGVPA